MNLQPTSAVIVDEAQFSEPVHEEADPRTGGADHFCQHLLTDLGNYGLRFAFLAKMGEQQKGSGQPLFARIEALPSWLSCRCAEQRNPTLRLQTTCVRADRQYHLLRKSLLHLRCRSLLLCRSATPRW